MDEAIEAKQMLQDFQNVSNEILGNFRSDRAQAEIVVQHLLGIVKIEGGVAEDVPRVFVEQLVSALAVKAEINANACKLLEAKAKMMSAGKGALMQNFNLGGAEIDALLSRPVRTVGGG